MCLSRNILKNVNEKDTTTVKRKWNRNDKIIKLTRADTVFIYRFKRVAKILY